MKGWREDSLGNGYIATNRKSIAKDYPFSEILYLDTGSITNGKVDNYQKILLENAPSRARRLLSKNDIIYSSVRPANRHYAFFSRPPDNLVVSTGFITITCNDKKLDPKFLYYYLTQNNIVDELHSIAEGSTSAYPSLLPTDIEATKIYFPENINEQRAIASVLSSLDDKIDLLHRQNATLEAMAEALFKQWFIVEAKEKWEIVQLGDLCCCITDKFDPKINNNTTRYIGLEHIDRKKIYISRYGKSDDIKSIKFKFNINDILFGKLRPYFHKICFTNFNGVCSTDILVLRPKNKNLFLYSLFSFYQKEVVDFATYSSSGTRMPRVDWNTLKSFELYMPDVITLEDFNHSCIPLINKVISNQLQINTLEKLRDSLLPKLMSGEVRVKY